MSSPPGGMLHRLSGRGPLRGARELGTGWYLTLGPCFLLRSMGGRWAARGGYSNSFSTNTCAEPLSWPLAALRWPVRANTE